MRDHAGELGELAVGAGQLDVGARDQLGLLDVLRLGQRPLPALVVELGLEGGLGGGESDDDEKAAGSRHPVDVDVESRDAGGAGHDGDAGHFDRLVGLLAQREDVAIEAEQRQQGEADRLARRHEVDEPAVAPAHDQRLVDPDQPIDALCDQELGGLVLPDRSSGGMVGSDPDVDDVGWPHSRTVSRRSRRFWRWSA